MTKKAASAAQPDALPSTEGDVILSAAAMLALAFVVGVVGGFGSIIFKSIIAFFHNLFFLGSFGLYFDQDVYMPATHYAWLVILVPVVGSVIVTWVTKTFAPEARGHGVPEVLDAIYYRDGKIRPVIVFAKAIVSAISIGTGGSVGREGPIVQVGSAFGSFLGQFFSMPARQRNILIAAGAAAGIAATFNAPIGGLSFAVELLLVSSSARTVTLVAVATVTATYIGRIYSGLAPSFDVPKLAMFEDHISVLYSLLFCIPLGMMTGLAAAGFIQSIYFSEDWFEERVKNEYLRHGIGMLGIGVMLYFFMRYSGHYYVEGVGYATVLDVLRGTLSNPWFLGLLFFAKLLATDVTIGSGASGGVFSPSLFLGATMGAAFGNFIAMLFPSLSLNPVIYTIAGMAAMVGGTTGAVLTAITMTFEQTRDYSVMLPIILTVSLSHIVRVRFCPESIYTLKLVRRGNYVPQGLQAAISGRSNAKKMMSTSFNLVDISNFSQWLAEHSPAGDPRYSLITREGEVIGLAKDELMYLLRDEQPERVIEQNFFLVTGRTSWAVIMRGMRRKKTETVIVTRRQNSLKEKDIIGVITPHELVEHAGLDAELMD
ncbi:MAG: chloride channel protein [Alphaproteobacteria bacterium]|nr:chloride channel protein [Alphaproteobacteria bacterium]